MRSVARLLLFFIAFIQFVSCARRITAEKPVLPVTDFKLDSLPDSEINIPVQISLAPFFKLAEKSVDTLFTSPGYPSGWVQETCDTRYKYTFRRSALQLKAAGNALNLGFTGYYRIIGSTRACVAGKALTAWTAPCTCGFNEPERRVNVSFTNTVALQPDYKVKLSIRRNEPRALDKCEVCFWGQDITNQVLKGLKEELDLSKTTLEKNFGTVDLRGRFQQVWDQLARPYNVYELGWLQINPRRLRINNFFAKGDSLYVYFGLSARPVVSLDKPAENDSNVPDIDDFSNKQGFNIFIDAQLNYDSLSGLLNRQLSGKSFDFKKGPVNKKFIISDCKLSGTGNEKLIIRINFTGTDNGSFYLTGKPVYTKETNVLEIKDVDFDIRSKDALLKTAEWLFSRRIINEVSKYTRFDLNAYTDSAKLRVNEQLNHEWMKGIRSTGAINDIHLIGVYPLDQFLVIRSNCIGRLSIHVESIDISL